MTRAIVSRMLLTQLPASILVNTGQSMNFRMTTRDSPGGHSMLHHRW